LKTAKPAANTAGFVVSGSRFLCKEHTCVKTACIFCVQEINKQHDRIEATGAVQTVLPASGSLRGHYER
jgi:histone acetyltransferase (RNA polymerase elongator complex component)